MDITLAQEIGFKGMAVRLSTFDSITTLAFGTDCSLLSDLVWIRYLRRGLPDKANSRLVMNVARIGRDKQHVLITAMGQRERNDKMKGFKGMR